MNNLDVNAIAAYALLTNDGLSWWCQQRLWLKTWWLSLRLNHGTSMHWAPDNRKVWLQAERMRAMKYLVWLSDQHV